MLRKVPMAVIRLYQLAVSPWLAPSCRFHPTCSCYALECYRHHGLLRGTWLTMRRLSRCHPWNAGGVDLVPEPATVAELPESELSVARELS